MSNLNAKGNWYDWRNLLRLTVLGLTTLFGGLTIFSEPLEGFFLLVIAFLLYKPTRGFLEGKIHRTLPSNVLVILCLASFFAAIHFSPDSITVAPQQTIDGNVPNNPTVKTSIDGNTPDGIFDVQEVSTDSLNASDDAEEARTSGVGASTTGDTDTLLPQSEMFPVTRVVDGDTVAIDMDGISETLRLIGINTPETVDPRKPVECFGVEASNKAKAVLTGQEVSIETDTSQGERDKYGRLLAYVFLKDGTNFNRLMIEEGYAYEYTYNLPYKYQSEFKEAQREAQTNNIGLWAQDACGEDGSQTQTPVTVPSSVSISEDASDSCTIKGNINSSGEKIFHVIGCGSYSRTEIDTVKGERWFCTEQDALDAGWRKALNCG
jgi:micrococcal nuclease